MSGFDTPPGLEAMRGPKGLGRPWVLPTPPTPGIRLDKETDAERLEAYATDGEGSLPERIIYTWLVEQEHDFITELIVGGGRMQIGGAVLDFIVYSLAAQPVALRIMGDYWHGPAHPERQSRDDEQASRLRARGYLVVDLLESEIYMALLLGRLTEYIEDRIWC